MAPNRERLRDPVLWTNVSQVVKTVAAAVLAWVLAADVLGLAQPFLAPWAALLTVHATVYRIDEAWAMVRYARESGRLNPRRGAARPHGDAICAADADALEQVRADVQAASRALPPDASSRTEQGALLVNLRNIADAMGAVAEAQPVRPDAPDHPVMPRRGRASPERVSPY